jgi:MoaA/NifB/PqqE/SkfB family radical SAM enzyme
LTIGLITNGRIFASKSFFNKLKNYNIAYLFISLHGSNPATHDSITKVPGSFEQGLLALKNINGQDTEPIVNFVILKENLHQLIEFIELMNKFNVKRIKFSLVNPPKSLNEISVPKMDIAAEKVKMGIDFANINYKNITIRWDGFPLCLMEGYENNLTNLKTEKILYLSYPWETDFSPPDEKDKVKIKQCNSCSKKDLCKGIYARYLKQANTLNPSK